MGKVRAYLLPDDGSSALVQFDLTLGEAHESTCEVTEHQVERGANIADHIIVNRGTLNLEVYVTNTPSNDLGGRGQVITQPLDYPRFQPPFAPTPGQLTRSARDAVSGLVGALTGNVPASQVSVLTFPEEMDRVKETHDALLDIQRRKVTCTVLTSTQTYESMVLLAVGLPRDHSGGASFNLNFKGIATVATATVQAPQPAEPRGKPSQAKGAQATKALDEQKKARVQSVAAKALDAGVAFLRGAP